MEYGNNNYGFGNANSLYKEEDDDLSWITSDKVNAKDATTALTANEVQSMISSITNSTASVADKALAFASLSANTKASIQAYQLALDNNQTSLSVAELNYQIAQLNLQMTEIETQARMLESNNSTTNTKYIVGGLAFVAVAGIIGFVAYNSKKK